MRKMIWTIFIVWQFVCIYESTASKTIYDISAIFDNKSHDLWKAFNFTVQRLNINDKVIHLSHKDLTSEIDVTDSFAVSNAICQHLEKGVYGVLGISKACALATIQSYSDTFQVPFITLSMPQNSSATGEPFQLYMRPYYIDGLLDIIQHYKWTRILYIYNTDEGLIRLQQLFQAVDIREWNLDIDVKRVINAVDCVKMLKDVYNREVNHPIRILIDLPTRESEDIIRSIKEDRDVSNHRFHFLLGDLGMREMNDTVLSSGMNITGFQLFNITDVRDEALLDDWRLFLGSGSSHTKIKFELALVMDAVRLMHRALKKFKYNATLFRGPSKPCRDNREYVKIQPGKEFLRELKTTSIDGLSGKKLAFDERGFRKGFVLPLLQTTVNMGVSKIGDFVHGKGLETHDPRAARQPYPPVNGNTSVPMRERKIMTIIDDPYVMYKDKNTEGSTRGKENFKGFCIDLAEKIANHVNFSYDIVLVPDGKYGNQLENGSWNGMMGALTRNEADLVIAPITISSARERYVDFTKPYMSLGISIMIKKPSDQKAHVFSFMDPLSYEIWMCILFAYVGVSVVLFLVSRFSPTEWHVQDDSNISNDFTISNSLWYSLGAFMQQGCDISPKAISGRIVGSVWWFFTLIIISSYTANLAAFLTVERMNTPIDSAEDLAKQTAIQYGTLGSGTTRMFFKQSKVAIYERMWAYMTSATPSVFVDSNKKGYQRVREQNGKYAFLVESTSNEYTNMRKPCDTMKVGSNLDSKGYGIATPIGSDLREKLTLAVLHFRESGELEQLKKKWWDERSECPPTGSGSEGGQTALTLHNVAGIFYILISGLTLAVLIAGLEFFYRSIVDSKKSKTTFGSMLRSKARLSFRGSLDHDGTGTSTPLRKSMSTYTYTGPPQLPGFDPYPDTNTHTQV